MEEEKKALQIENALLQNLTDNKTIITKPNYTKTIQNNNKNFIEKCKCKKEQKSKQTK